MQDTTIARSLLNITIEQILSIANEKVNKNSRKKKKKKKEDVHAYMRVQRWCLTHHVTSTAID